MVFTNAFILDSDDKFDDCPSNRIAVQYDLSKNFMEFIWVRNQFQCVMIY